MSDAVDKVTNRPERTEGGVAKAIEKQTSKMPSDWFLIAAVGAISASLAMQVAGSRHKSLFIGQWVPSILLLGVYNKIVKVAGSDRFDQGGTMGRPDVSRPGMTTAGAR
ncbi:MAG TPA: hypothetical protein VE326_07085 [Candidatus Binatia bacterium]|nr:hypothetical protein [Candidatus Binatia bacterium]